MNGEFVMKKQRKEYFFDLFLQISDIVIYQEGRCPSSKPQGESHVS